MKDKYLIIDKRKIFYRENISNSDDKKILFFMHGWGASSDLFLKIFPENKNWIAIDFPNFGKSEKSKDVLDMEDYAKITKKFIDKTMKEKEIFFITHSFGGRVLLKMMSLFNLNTEKAIFIGVPFYRPEINKINKKSILIKNFHKIFNLPVLKIIKKPLQKVLYKLVYSKDYLELQDDKIMQETFKKVVSDDIAKYIPLLKTIKNILIWGENDTTVPLKIPEKFLKELPKSDFYKISKAGHFPFLENTKEFNKIFNKVI